MKMFRKSKKNQYISIMVICFVLVFSCCASFYFLAYRQKQLDKLYDAKVNKNKKVDITKKYTYENLENIDFVDETKIKKEVAKYIKNGLEYNNVNLVVFLDKTTKEASDMFTFYFQINSKNNEIIKGFYNRKDDVFEFSMANKEDIDDISDIGGVADGESLDALYNKVKKLNILKIDELSEKLQEKGLDEEQIEHITDVISHYIGLLEYNQDSLSTKLNFGQFLEEDKELKIDNTLSFNVVANSGYIVYVYYFIDKDIVEVYDSQV